MALALEEPRAFAAPDVPLAAGPRIAVFRSLRGVGDMLAAGPALRLMRTALPFARIALIGVEEARPTVSRMARLFDDFVTFPGWPGLPESPRRHPADQRRQGGDEVPRAGDDLRRSRIEDWCDADAVVQMHGDGTVSNGFCASLDPQRLVAYGPAVTRSRCELHTAPYPRHLNEIDRCLELAARTIRLLGGRVVPANRTLEFALTDEDRREAARLLSGLGITGRPYFVMHPGSHLPDRRWPAERFAEVGRVLADHGFVLVSGLANERALAEAVARAVGPHAMPIAGDTSLGGIAALLDGSRGLVTNDTGISHLAAARGTRSVVVFLASDPHRWAPLDTGLHAHVVRPALDDDGVLTPEGIRLAAPEISAVLEAVADVGMIEREA